MGWKGSIFEVPVWALGRLLRSGRDPARQPPHEILVLRPNDFGDLLTTTPIFEALRRRFPASRIIAGVGSWGRAIVENNPYVDEIVEVDAPWNNKFVADQSWRNVFRYIWGAAQVEGLRKRGGFDVGIDVLGSHVGALLMMRLRVRYRVGVRGYRGGWSACDQYIRFSPQVHVARAALAQAELLGASELPEARPQLYLTAAERAEACQIWRAGAHPERPPLRLLVGCAAGHSVKTWSSNALGAALGELARVCVERQLDVVIVGGPADQVRAKEVIAASGAAARIRSLAGQISLRGTFALTEQADVVLTNPSMLLHVAAAFRRPTVAVLGGTFADAAAHDAVWGYPPPYMSVAPSQPAPGEERGKRGTQAQGGSSWPSVDQVVQAVLAAARCGADNEAFAREASLSVSGLG
ncbi:MAG: glycosyltransferase family 9 protein [Paraburkholderia sp.]|jgi:ADP-heptose:LPS heptosyltransferase|uniref:glycosyltransferase family 9 protein n=1 Tax=Burkholderiaceae TaxID=119060 RepID=UPI0010F996B3|nr:glycosyltransferase family 9 protein [Burkholderia sp. 4M9327F10]